MWVSSLYAGTPPITGGQTVCVPARTQSQAEVSTKVAPARVASCRSTLASPRNVASRTVKQRETSEPTRQVRHDCGSGGGAPPIGLAAAAGHRGAPPPPPPPAPPRAP